MEKRIPVVELKEGDVFTEEAAMGSQRAPYKVKAISAETGLRYGVPSVLLCVEVVDWPDTYHPQERFRRIAVPATGEVVVHVEASKGLVWTPASDLCLRDKIRFSPESLVFEVQGISMASDDNIVLLVGNGETKTSLIATPGQLLLKELPAEVTEVEGGWKKVKAKNVRVGDTIKTSSNEFVVVKRTLRSNWFSSPEVEFELALRRGPKTIVFTRTCGAEHKHLVLAPSNCPPKAM